MKMVAPRTGRGRDGDRISGVICVVDYQSDAAGLKKGRCPVPSSLSHPCQLKANSNPSPSDTVENESIKRTFGGQATSISTEPVFKKGSPGKVQERLCMYYGATLGQKQG